MATISASFTAVDQVSTGLLVPEGQSATCGASGTYAASILLERTRDGGQTWETITTSSTPNATVSQVVTDPGTYRWRCDAFTSGTVAVTLANEVAILFGPIRNAAGEIMFEVTTDGVTTDGTATGFGAALTGFTGASNTGLGTGAGGDVAFGENVSVGKNAAAGVRGSDNTVVGFGALGSCTNVVSRNVAIGATALGNGNVSGGNNVAVGYEALSTLVGGNGVTACGYQAGNEITSGTGSVALGYQAGKGQGNVSNQFMVGLGNGQGLIFSVDEGGLLLNISVRFADGTMHATTGLALAP